MAVSTELWNKAQRSKVRDSTNLSRIRLVGCAKGKVQGAGCIAQGSKLLCAERQEPCYDECSRIERTILRCVSGYMVLGARHGVSEGTMLAFFFLQASCLSGSGQGGWVGIE